MQNVTFVDNSKHFITAFEQACQNALNAIGSKAEGYAKQACPVATGRLHNSITYATSTQHSKGNDRRGEHASAEEMAMKATPEKTAVYIGTNVVYAPYVEFLSMHHETGRAHFLKDAASNHGEEYKRIAEAAMKAV